jgi:hypothetical protein
MSVRQYSVRELRRVIKESSNEFKPVMGRNVEKDNKKINVKAYQEIENETRNYDGGATKDSKKTVTIPKDDNRGMSDLQYDTPLSKKKMEDAAAQVEGYTSAQAKKLHKDDPYGNAEFHEVKGLDDKAQAFQNGRNLAKCTSNLNGELTQKDYENLTSNMFDKKSAKNESRMYRLKFKNTVFMTENQMLSKVPDDFKVEGKKFSMRDKHDNEFIVEWADEPKVTNLTKINEQKNRIHELFNYKRGESNTSSQTRLAENKNVEDMLNKARQLMK